jgi:hypothetical protein
VTVVGIYLAKFILDRARLAHGRITAADDLEPGQMDALDAIVFAAASTEAFINEFAAIAHERAARGSTLVALPDDDRVQRTGRVLHDLEANRGAIRQKYSISHFLLCGQDYNKGAQPWQDFDALIRVRDAILHLRMDEFALDKEGNRTYPKLVQGLSNRGILAPDTPRTTIPWIAIVATRSAAKWAINSACHIVISILDAVPSNDPLHTSWRPGFQPMD